MPSSPPPAVQVVASAAIIAADVAVGLHLHLNGQRGKVGEGGGVRLCIVRLLL